MTTALISRWLLLAVPFSLGTGLPYLLGLAFVGSLTDWRRVAANLMERPKLGRSTWIYLFLVSVFLGLYTLQSRLDLFPLGFSLSQHYFIKVGGASLLVVLLPILFKDSRDCLYFMGAIALGAFARGSATVLLTSYYLSLPSFGDVFDLRTWSVGNRSPFSNMLILAAVFFAGVLANQKAFNLNFHARIMAWLFLVVTVIFGVWLQARLFLIIVFAVCPGVFLVGSLVDAKRSKELGLLLALGMLFIAGFYMINYFELGQRGPALSSALTDIRFDLYKSFWHQVSANPWVHAQLDPLLVERYGIPQFHNFFADVQRVSGTWAFLAAVILVAYICYLVTILVKSGDAVGRFLGFLLVPCLIVLNTSVEPEGGGQNYLMVLVIGVAAAVRFDHTKSEAG